MAKKEKEFHIGDEVYIHGYIDEIRGKDHLIIRNDGGYFGTVRSEASLVKSAVTTEIKYGDELFYHPDHQDTKRVVVIDIYSNEEVVVLDEFGCSMLIEKKHTQKTGRYFPQIGEVLNKLKE